MSFTGKNIKQNTVTYTPQAADPVSPFEGMIFRADGTSREEGLWEYRNGDWKKIGSDEGSSFNLFSGTNSNFEAGLGNWVRYKNTVASAIPETGTGGTPDAEFALSLETANPLLNSRSALITADAAIDLQGNGISCDSDTVPEIYRGRPFSLVLQNRGFSDYADGDFEVFIYDITNSQLIATDGDNSLLSGYESTQVNFYIPATCTQIRLIIHCAVSTTLAKSMLLDNIVCNLANLSNIQFDLAASKAIKTSTQSIPNQGAGADTKVTFDSSLDYNLGGAVTWDSINNRMVFTRSAFGYAQATVEFAANAAGFRRGLIKLNGNIISRDTRINASASAVANAVADTLPRQFEAGDYIEFFVTQNSGGNLDITGTNINEFVFQETRSAGSVQALAQNSYLRTIKDDSGGRIPYVIAAGTFGDLATIEIPKAGKWNIEINNLFHANGTISANTYILGLSTNSGDDSTGLVEGLNRIQGQTLTTSGEYYSNNFTVEVETTGPETYYFKSFRGGTVTNLQVAWSYIVTQVPNSNVALTATQDAELYLQTGNGFGSSNTSIRRYTNIRKNTLGSLATYADSATLGMSVTVHVKSVWSLSLMDVRTGGVLRQGFSINATNGATPIQSLGYANGERLYAEGPGSAVHANIAQTVVLEAGDVVRSHGGGGADPTAAKAAFTMVFLGYAK